MENEKFLPCKSCGKSLNSYAVSCPHCGDPSPFCFDVKTIEQRGEEDAEKINRVEKRTVIIAFVVPIALYFITHIWWLSIIALIALGLLGMFITSKKDDELRDLFLVGLDSDYKKFKNWFHYDLTDEQCKLWKDTVHSIYVGTYVRHKKNIYGKMLS